MRAEVTAPLCRGFEQILEARPPIEARALAPRICGICSVSQSVAAAVALRDAMAAEVAPNGILATNLAHEAEKAGDHLTHFYIFFMPDFAREACAAHSWHEETRDRFAATRGLRHVMSCRRGRGCSNLWVSSPGNGRIVWPSSRPMSAARWSRR